MRKVSHLTTFLFLLWMNCTEVTMFAGKEEVLKLHPNLAGHSADGGKLTKDSSREQQNAGIHNLTPEQKAQINQLNVR